MEAIICTRQQTKHDTLSVIYHSLSCSTLLLHDGYAWFARFQSVANMYKATS